jgi:phenylpropionate dioxygenase-like ring-hydroxylating dioxygenase large terminal subunit
MFIRNCWYVVAWDHEIAADTLFARTVIGEPLVLHRTAAGKVVAKRGQVLPVAFASSAASWATGKS